MEILKEDKIGGDTIRLIVENLKFKITINNNPANVPIREVYKKSLMDYNNVLLERRYVLKNSAPQPVQQPQPSIQQPQPQQDLTSDVGEISNEPPMTDGMEADDNQDDLSDIDVDSPDTNELDVDNLSDEAVAGEDMQNTDGDEDGEDSIESLAGKIMQKVRNYDGDDYTDKAKYAFNMILSGLNLDRMSDEDRHDIRKKFDKKFGDGDVF